MKRTILFLLLSTFSLFASDPWPGVEFTEVRAYAWRDDKETGHVILPGMTLKPGVINKKGALLTPDQIKRLRAAVTRKLPSGTFSAPGAGCYVPHNAFVFYAAEKKPVAFFEVCFACRGSRGQPEHPGEWTDYIGLASIFDELKLPMGRYRNLKAFKKHFQGE